MKETSHHFLMYSRACYLKGVDAQKQPTSFNRMQAILTLHDAIDFCVRAITEEYDIHLDQNDSLMQLIKAVNDHFKQKQSVKKLPRQSQIQFLDTTRGKDKHQASIPSLEDTRQLLAHSTYFLEYVTEQYFEMEFERISQVSLINDEKLRRILHYAEDRITNDQYLDALIAIKYAYLSARPAPELFLGPHPFPNIFQQLTSFPMSIPPARATSGIFGSKYYSESHVDTSGITSAIKEISRTSIESIGTIDAKIQRLEEALIPLQMGSDILAYRRFAEITPSITLHHNLPIIHKRTSLTPTAQIAQEALLYATDMILRWQDIGVIPSNQTTQEQNNKLQSWEIIELPDSLSHIFTEN